MISTLWYFFSARDNELLLLTVIFDLICLWVFSFLLGYHSSLLFVVLEAGIIGACGSASNRYFDRREKKRLAWANNDCIGTFPLSWMRYADLWADMFRRPMGAIFLVILIAGKIAAYFFS